MHGDMKNKAYRIKIFRVIQFLMITSVFLLTACEEDDSQEYPDPTINLVSDPDYISSDAIVAVGQTFKIGIHAEWNEQNRLTNFIAFQNGERYIDLGIYKEEYDREIEITKGLEDTDEWEFMIRDYAGQWSSVSLTITKNPNIEYGEILEFDDIRLGAQNSAEYGSFFSFGSGNVYTLQEAFSNQEIVNLVYYYDGFDNFEENIIASPGANISGAFTGDYGISNWTTLYTIRYSAETLDVSADDFDSASNDSILLAHAFAFESGKRKAKYLEEGYIFSFVTEDNRAGMFKVESVDGTDAGNIVVDIKVQK